MNFIPEQQNQRPDRVPYFHEANADDGWRGHATKKSISALKSEITNAVGRLGGLVVGFQKGSFLIGNQQREGFRVHYSIEKPGGIMVPARLDIAALPVNEERHQQSNLDNVRKKSLRMALYMLRESLAGLWFLQKLSPGYAGLMPWALDKGSGKTITQLWSESEDVAGYLMPPAESDFVEGSYEEVTG